MHMHVCCTTCISYLLIHCHWGLLLVLLLLLHPLTLLARVKLAVLTPTILAKESSIGPPLLPALMEASVCTSSSNSSCTNVTKQVMPPQTGAMVPFVRTVFVEPLTQYTGSTRQQFYATWHVHTEHLTNRLTD